MIQLTKITNQATQNFNLVSETGEVISFSLRYLPRVAGWVFDCSFGNFSIKGARLTISPNTLRGYRNIIDFGLMCVSTDGYEPQYLNDFVTGRVTLYLLNPTDVASVESKIFNAA